VNQRNAPIAEATEAIPSPAGIHTAFVR